MKNNGKHIEITDLIDDFESQEEREEIIRELDEIEKKLDKLKNNTLQNKKDE